MTKLEHITELRNQRMSLEEIAQLYNVTKQAIHSYCKYNNILKGEDQSKEVKLSHEEKRLKFLLANINKDPKTSCWEWQKTKTPAGYGRMSYKGVSSYTHRVAYHLLVDTTFNPFQSGRNTEFSQHILHTCDNPCCCNPEHLWVGTPLENMRDRDIKGRNGRDRSK